MIDEALRAAKVYGPVFPCKDKRPLTAHGFKDATRDAEQIQRWWAEYPDAQIGLATGAVSGFVVVDLDVADDGALDGFEWAADVGLPETLTATTPSGGEHRYYALPEGQPVPSSASQLAPHVDIRGDGGYVILPPSRNGAGSWAWDDEGLLAEPLPACIPRGTTRTSSQWRTLDDGDLDPALVAAVDELQERGGHHPVLHAPRDRDPWVEVTRPGKLAGASASVGYVGRGAVKVFTSNWPDLPAGRYSVDELVAARSEGRSARTTDAEWAAHVDAQAASEDLESDPDVFDLVAGVEPEHDWVIPDALDRTDRLIVTGEEGGGKSTLLRQVAIQVGAGVHPFTGESMPAKRVLLVDCENSRRHVRTKIRDLIELASSLERGMVIPVIQPQGINLLDADDRLWLRDRVAANRPDLLICGPLYKLALGNPNDEEPARLVSATLDAIRVEYQCALILEAHTPHAPAGRTKRPTRPFGASLWLRWPEFGKHLDASGTLNDWRGDREERVWPPALSRSGDWPWTVETAIRRVTLARLLDEVHRAGGRLTERELADRTGFPKSTIHRAIEANRQQWEAVCDEVPE